MGAGAGAAQRSKSAAPSCSRGRLLPRRLWQAFSGRLRTDFETAPAVPAGRRERVSA